MPERILRYFIDVIADTLCRLLATPLSLVFRPIGALTIEVVLVRDLRLPLPEVKAPSDLTVRSATEADLEWIAKLYRDEPYLYLGDGESANSPAPLAGPAARDLRAIEAYRNRLQRGEKCFLAFAGSQIAHVNWLCFKFGEEAVPGHPIVLRSNECYTTDALTLKDFRGKNIHAVVLRVMLAAAQLAGRQRAFTVTRVDRRGSFGAFRQLRWQVYGRLLCLVPKDGGKIRLFRLMGSIEPLLRG